MAHRKRMRFRPATWLLVSLAALSLVRFTKDWGQTLNLSVPCAPESEETGVGRLLPGTMLMRQPSQDVYLSLQEHPNLAKTGSVVVSEFEAMPWLLPPGSAALTYSGVHDLERLLQIRAKPFGSHPKTVSILFFMRHKLQLMQNTIYSMVKFGSVRNYIVGVLDETDLEACSQLNLPCANIANLLPEPLESCCNMTAVTPHDTLVLKWLRHVVVSHLLQKGYVTFYTDPDVVFTLKPVWDSYMTMIEAEGPGLDGVIDEEGSTSMILPTAPAIEFFTNWTGYAKSSISQRLDDFKVMWYMHERKFVACTTSSRYCMNEVIEKIKRRWWPMSTEGEVAIIRVMKPGFFMLTDDRCFLSRPDTYPLDMCDWTILYLNPVCSDTREKINVYKTQSLWFIDDESCMPGQVLEADDSLSRLPACQPLRWRLENVEKHLYSCPEYGLALWHAVLEGWRRQEQERACAPVRYTMVAMLVPKAVATARMPRPGFVAAPALQ